MKIDKDRLELVTSILLDEDSWVYFYFKKVGKRWAVGNEDVVRYNKWKPDDDSSYEDNDVISYESFLEDVEDVELTAEYDDIEMTEWEKFANYIGVSKLVCVSTKVPEVIAKRFKYFSNDTVSSQLRTLIYNYVSKKIEEKSDEIMFKGDF